MIPLKLHIKNFLSYGSEVETINFEPYHLICLSGKNGHGKSALLDAITWALWGHARKTSNTAKADHGLLRLGQTQMMVTLDFSCRGILYRIKREFMQTYGKPLASLEFGIHESAERIIPLTGKTIRETQATIEKTLNLNFDSFINSAFLRQGQSNEFSKKSSKERKEVLGTILGLNHYDDIKRIALEKIRHGMQQKTAWDAITQKLEMSLATAQTLITRMQELERALQEMRKNEDVLSAEQHLLDVQKNTLQNNYTELAAIAKTLSQKEQEEQHKLHALRDLVATWRRIHATTLTALDPRELEEKKQQLMQELTKHQERFQQHLALKEQWLKQKEQLQSTELQLRNEYTAALHKRQIELERLTMECTAQEKNKAQHLQLITDHQQALQKIETEEKLLEQQQKDIACTTQVRSDCEKQFEKRKQYYHHWTAQGNVLANELQALKKKSCLVGDEEAPSCPLCEQNLSAARRRFLKKQFSDDEQFLAHRLARLETILKTLKPLLIEQHQQLESYKKIDQTSVLIQSKIIDYALQKKNLITQLETMQIQQSALEKSLLTLKETIAAHEKQLNQMKQSSETLIKAHESYQIQKANLELLEEALKSLPYDANHHTHLNIALATIDTQITTLKQLHEERTQQEQRKRHIHDIILVVKQIRSENALFKEKLLAQKALDKEQAALNQSEAMVKEKTKQLYQKKEELLQEKGALENQKIQLAHHEEELGQTKKQLTALDATMSDLQAIAHATGKDGIQALLIDEAIPEIEQEANHLLSRLTDNQTQLFIESLRDLKKGGTKETLDIRISDAVGIRPYEMFSGGEAFRIDFALRIAISKLLARRAGTTLQTLIIDEGFGSQDEEGLGHIMDALYKIQEDFAKIIIVSHLTSMKEQFPVHFFIEKGPHGSHVKVIEQG